jgi:hypothetical protein
MSRLPRELHEIHFDVLQFEVYPPTDPKQVTFMDDALAVLETQGSNSMYNMHLHGLFDGVLMKASEEVFAATGNNEPLAREIILSLCDQANRVTNLWNGLHQPMTEAYEAVTHQANESPRKGFLNLFRIFKGVEA